MEVRIRSLDLCAPDPKISASAYGNSNVSLDVNSLNANIETLPALDLFSASASNEGTLCLVHCALKE